MDYDFTRLSHRSFEQMIQSLSLAAIGPGVNIFGDGPDGGREATFEGMSSFPDKDSPWTGYGIIQAKFRQRTGDKDGEWAITEFEKDLKKVSENKKIRKPQYYIFVTNVILTPVAETGSKDKLVNVIEKYRKKIGLKDYRIWDRDQICALLDVHSSVRTAYTAWITAGDVLSAVLDQMTPKNTDFKNIMFNFIQKELRAEQYVNLGQAGHNVKDRIPLACVFVDLPVGDTTPNKRQQENSRENSNPPEKQSAINRLLIESSKRLDPNSTSLILSQPGYSSDNVAPGRFVFIGGPGQGKSTLTQFFCQLHRASFLQQFPLATLSPEVRDAYQLILSQSNQESVPPPQIPRFPIRIELNRFATALATKKATSLFNYILGRIEERSEQALEPSDLRKWLSSYPWIVALDGLDEVPASSNRAEVLNSIQDFIIDAHGCNADLLLITTSRPQGYNNDFSDNYYKHLNLSPLNNEEALHYAKRLIDRRWGEDEDKVKILIERLSRASSEDATARLMQSPLQVTIMTLLVETLGEPPKERWRLFNEYYQVINRREKERDIPAAKLLNTHQADIDYIHQKVGINLQVKSEQAGGTEALLSEAEFSHIIKNRLDDEGHFNEEGKQLKNNIINAALERLVFLVAPQENRIGFEIRSLQEFMAAQSLMNGSDIDICARLRSIAHASHWRNVFLFAAGRCFHERQHLRDNIFSLCSQLNEGIESGLTDSIEKITLIGSQLALDILEDGAISSQPTQQKIFSRLSMRLFELPPSRVHSRLANTYNQNLKDIFQEHIHRALAVQNSDSFNGAWRTLLALCNLKIDWAIELAQAKWPNDPEFAFTLASETINASSSTWLVQKWYDAIAMSPARNIKMHRLPGFGGREETFIDKNSPQWIKDLITCANDNNRTESTLLEIDPNFKVFLLNATYPEASISAPPTDIHRSWRWLHSAIGFCSSPSNKKLSELIYDYLPIYEDNNSDSLGEWAWILPWQISLCINKIDSKKRLIEIAEAAKSGKLGDKQDWLMAEERWSKSPLSIKDLNYTPADGLPFDKGTLQSGYPAIGANPYFTARIEREKTVLQLLPLFQATTNQDSRRLISTAIFYNLSVISDDEYVAPPELVKDITNLFLNLDTSWFDLTLLKTFPEDFWATPDAEQLIKGINTIKYKCSYLIEHTPLDFLERRVLSSPTDIESIKLLSRFCAFGSTCNLTKSNLNIENLHDPEAKLSIILILVSQSEYELEEAEIFVKNLISIFPSDSNYEEYLIRLLTAFEESPTVTESTERFLHLMHESHFSQNQKIRTHLMYSLQEHQRYHLSKNQKILL